MKRIFDKTTLVTLSLLSLVGPLRGTAMAAQLTCKVPIVFGTATPCNAPGSFTVSPQGVRSGASGCVTLLPGNYSQGACLANTTNISNTMIQLTVPASDTISSGADTMVVNKIVMATSGGAVTGAAITVSGIQAAIEVGAQLTVGANQPAGTYSGSFVVTATFQ